MELLGLGSGRAVRLSIWGALRLGVWEPRLEKKISFVLDRMHSNYAVLPDGKMIILDRMRS